MAEDKNKVDASEPEVPAQKYYTPRSELDILSDENIIAEDLMPPDTFEVRYLVPGIRCRWVNWKSREGQMMYAAQAEGYSHASKNDVECTVKPNKEGKFINGDVVLMKISEARYASAMKALVLRTKMAAGATAEAAMEEMKGLMRRSGGHLTPFAPDQAQLDRLIDANQAVTHNVTRS
jgi:hypothetical protein